mmetsp:Transcript_3570/g.7360  ORF Transcript_3570/g.7360 Transcript_3570/m.7360 type:complete len:521 (-) Transcript_3570:465-2027(-)
MDTQNYLQFQSAKVARTITNVIQSTLGPRSNLKMILDNQGRLVVTNDGNSILREIETHHPIACSLIELSRAQDNEVGDGTTSVVILASEILKITEILLQKGFHPNQIIGSYFQGLNKSLIFLNDRLSMCVNPDRFQEIKKVVSTCICTKLVSRFARLMCELSFKAIRILNLSLKPRETNYFLKIEKVPGGQIEQSKIFSGLMVEKDVSHPKMRRLIDNPKIILLDCPVEFKKGETLTTSFEITDRKQWEKILKMEEDHIVYLCNLLKIFNPDIVISEKGISEIALHYLNKSNISVLKRVKKSDNIRISKATGANIVSSIEDLEFSDIGKANKFMVKKLGEETYSFFIGEKNTSPCTALLFGPSRDILDEMERNLQDAIEVSKSILLSPKVLPGGGATELAIGNFLSKKSHKFKNENFFVFKTMAEAFEIIPKTLIQNCGYSPVYKINQLKNFHSKKGFFFGIDGRTGNIIDVRKTGIFDLYNVKMQIYKIAFENATTILRIDKILSGVVPTKEDQNKKIN